MEIFPALLSVITDPMLLFAIVLAAVVGMIVGATPGLTASAAIAMLLPITFYMPPLFALAFLYVIGKSGRYGGSIAAIDTPLLPTTRASQSLTKMNLIGSRVCRTQQFIECVFPADAEGRQYSSSLSFWYFHLCNNMQIPFVIE